MNDRQQDDGTEAEGHRWAWPVEDYCEVEHPDGNGDACEAYPMEQLQFDLSDLKEAWQEAYKQDSGTIHINLEGWDKPVEYFF